MFHEWITFAFPLVEAVMNWYWFPVLILLVLFSILFGLYYEPDDEYDFMDVYVIPVAGTIVPALMSPGAIALLILTLPVWGSVALACALAYGIYKITKRYKEKNQ